MGVKTQNDKPQDVVDKVEDARPLISCQDLYSKENAGLICISQLFGASQYWCFIAEISVPGFRKSCKG
jgi:hypothetical protein